ncbi:MAG: hypothetical protein EA382_08520 [Spirochaetaceae bacterium]|nr:MAG: hypothetical protein EA382_08520 [Spirochaetaceae bacterium]
MVRTYKSVRRTRRVVCGVAAFALLSVALPARDLPEPPQMANPFAHASDLGPLTGAYHDVAYHHNALIPGAHDLFTVRQRAAFSLWRGQRFAASLYWGTFLFVGPDHQDLDPASIFTWFMHSVQFEYGLLAGVALPGRFDSLVFEYGRTSQHPLLGGYGEVSSDIVRMSVWMEPVRVRSAVLTAGLRGAFIDLLAFWQSVLAKPRTAVLIEPVVELHHAAGTRAQLFARLYPRVHVTRTTGQWPWAVVEPRVQYEIDAELGVRSVGPTRVELLLDLYASPDSEQVRGAASPVVTAGVAIRFVSSALSFPSGSE